MHERCPDDPEIPDGILDMITINVDETDSKVGGT